MSMLATERFRRRVSKYSRRIVNRRSSLAMWVYQLTQRVNDQSSLLGADPPEFVAALAVRLDLVAGVEEVGQRLASVVALRLASAALRADRGEMHRLAHESMQVARHANHAGQGSSLLSVHVSNPVALCVVRFNPWDRTRAS